MGRGRRGGSDIPQRLSLETVYHRVGRPSAASGRWLDAPSSPQELLQAGHWDDKRHASLRDSGCSAHPGKRHVDWPRKHRNDECAMAFFQFLAVDTPVRAIAAHSLRTLFCWAYPGQQRGCLHDTGMTFIPVRDIFSYHVYIKMPMFVVPEWLCCFPDQHACATRSSQLGYSFHTGTNLVTAFTWYRYGLWSAFIPERNFRTGTRTGVNSYRYDSYRCGISYHVITNTEPQVGTGMDSYRNESHTGIM